MALENTITAMIIRIFVLDAVVLPSRASDLCEAAQQCGGVGR